MGVPQGEVPGSMAAQVPVPPRLTENDTPDQPSPLDRIGKWLGSVYGHSDPRAMVGDVVLDTANRVASGVNSTVISILRAPGLAAEAIQNLGADKPFEPTWKAPVSSMLVGSSRLLKGLEEEVTVAPKPSDTWINQLPEAFGSAAAFMGTGGLAGAAGFSPFVASAALGGAVGATQQYDDAIQNGATPEQAAIAYVGGAAFGTTEAVPGAFFLAKLNKLTGGGVAEAIKKYGIQGEHSALLETFKGGLEEAIQEGIQQIGNNWVAKDLAGYDPTRNLGENFWSNIATGGIVGSFIGGGLGLMRKAQVNRTLKELDDKRNMLMGTGDPINYLEGDFTPVGDLVNLRDMQNRLAVDLNTRKEGAFSEVNAQEQFPPLDIISQASQNPVYGGATAGGGADLSSQLLDKPINTRVEKALPATQPDGTPTTIRQALELTPVVAVDTNPYVDLIDRVSNSITQHEEAMRDHPDLFDLPKAQVILNMLKSQRLALMAKSQIADRVISQIKQYSAVFSKVLNPDLKLIITGTPSFDSGKVTGTAGFYALTNDVTMVGGKKVPLGTLYVNVDSLVTEIYNNKKSGLTEDTHQARRALFETLNHELGHSIAVGQVAKIYRDAQSQDPILRLEAHKMLSLMIMEYRTWLEKAARSKQSFLLLSQFAPERSINAASHASDEGIFLHQTEMSAPFPNGMRKDYLLSFDEFFAEMTARLATQGYLSDEVMTRYFTPVLQQYQTMFANMPAFAKSSHAQDWLLFLQERTYQYKVNQELERVAASGGRGIINVLRYGLDGYHPEAFAGLQEHLDRFDKLISWGFNLMQLTRENPHIPHLQSYLKAIAAWSEYQRNFQADANDTYKAWRSLGKIEAAQLTEVLFDEALDRQRYEEHILSRRLTTEARIVYNQIREQLDHVLEEMRAVATLDVTRTILDNEELLTTELAAVNEDFDRLKAQGYFPFIRFGKYTITARAREELTYNGTSYKRGALMAFPAFETEKERDVAISEIRKELKETAHVASGVMRETDFVIQGMPRSLLRSLRSKLEATGDLSPEQATAFEYAMAEVAPFRNFRKHFLRKKGIEGYSQDALRSFAYYVRSAAGHIARVKFSDALREPIAGIQQDVEVIKETGGRSDERQEMRHWLDRHFSYVMNPSNEWAALRGVGFVAYLGFNIKSALVNGTQLLTTVGPYLAARYGDATAVSELTKATWTLKDWIASRKSFTEASEGSGKHRVLQMIERGKHEGWLDQSLATELAIAASENNLDRGLYLPKARRFWHEVSRYSALPFHLVEKMNRYITAIAAYNLEFQVSSSHEKAVLAARQANWSANYENARWNRPEFMRGKKSVFFLFANYLQNTLYFATHDKGAVRYWLMMMLLAGLMGLPGAEDVADLVDFAVTYLSRILGYKNPKTQIRRELRDHLEELGANPDLILHGLSQDTFGLGHVGELTGIPIPHLDVSRSVGMGDVLPLTEVPSMFLQAEPNDVLVAAAKGAAGASGNLVEEFYRSLLSDSPDDWKRAERILPIVAARNVMKAARLAMSGQESTASGDVIAKFDPQDQRDQLELLGQALGFSPSKMTLGWERELAARDMIQYYKVQQAALLKQIAWAFLQDDRESKADVMAAIRQYNEQVPQPEMKLGSKTIKTSLQNSLKNKAIAGAGYASEKKYRRLQQEVEESYPDPYGKDRKESGFSP